MRSCTEGVVVAKKDGNAPKHPDLEAIPNLHVMMVMKSLASRNLVKQQLAWRHYYWTLTDEGIEYLRNYLQVPADVVPLTHQKSTRPMGRPSGERPERRERTDRAPRDRDEYRPRQFGDEKKGFSGDAQPEFRGRGAGGERPAGGFGGGRGRGAAKQ